MKPDSDSNFETDLPDEIARKMQTGGVQKANLSFTSTFVLAILAGAFISLGGIYFTFTTSQITLTQPFTQVLGGLTFSLGLILVVVAGAELFTGNNLMILGLASKKIVLPKLLRNWIIVYCGNFVGAIGTSVIFYLSSAWTANDYQIGIRAITIASTKTNHGFVEAFFLGMLCNSLVCLAIWLANSGKRVSDKILAIIFPISAFVALGFEHSIANMYFLTFALLIKNDPLLMAAMQKNGMIPDMSHLNILGMFNNLLPVTLGNIVGGSLLIGFVYWIVYLRNGQKEK